MLSGKQRTIVWIITGGAVVSGLMTIKSGGSVLFIDGAVRQAAGNYVDFVVWFNFLAGFLYIVTGVGILFKKSWALAMAIIIAVSTFQVLVGFGIHILNAGEYEQRTVIAMSIRTLVWTAIAVSCWRWSLWRTA